MAGQVSEHTVARDRAVLHSIFALAERLEIVPSNPVRAVPTPRFDKHEPVILSAEQYEALLRECQHDDMLALYVLTLGESGGRSRSEILHLRFDDVDLTSGMLPYGAIRIVSDAKRKGARTKSGKSRHVPMTPRLQQAMRDHFARYRFASYGGRRSEWLFHHVVPHAHAVAGQRIGNMDTALKSAARRAGVPEGFRPSDLRHRRVSQWLVEGADVTLVKEAMGHADLKTTMHYTTILPKHLGALVKPRDNSARIVGEEREQSG